MHLSTRDRFGCVRPVKLLVLYSASAALSISFATGSGFDTITTCEAPLITTVSWACARAAMNAEASGGMFLSLSP